MVKTVYERTWQQNEDLGINDMVLEPTSAQITQANAEASAAFAAKARQQEEGEEEEEYEEAERLRKGFVGMVETAAAELAKAAEGVAPVPDEDFQTAEIFDGSRAGFVFHAGPNGLGYYKDC
jgi:hypothetical protein